MWWSPVTASPPPATSSASTCTLCKSKTWRWPWTQNICLVLFQVQASFHRFIAGNNRSVSLSCENIWHLSWIHSLVRCLFREPGRRRHHSGAKHGPKLRVKHTNTRHCWYIYIYFFTAVLLSFSHFVTTNTNVGLDEGPELENVGNISVAGVILLCHPTFLLEVSDVLTQKN